MMDMVTGLRDVATSPEEWDVILRVCVEKINRFSGVISEGERWGGFWVGAPQHEISLFLFLLFFAYF